MSFYGWVCRHPLSKKDLRIRELYLLVAASFYPRVSVAHSEFSGRGAQLELKIVEFLDGAGNDFESVAVDYFTAYSQAILEWGKISLFNQPSTIFGKYAWNKFLDWIEQEHGGVHNYLQFSRPEQIAQQSIREELTEIQWFRSKVLEQGNMNLYDQLGNVDKLDHAIKILESAGYGN